MSKLRKYHIWGNFVILLMTVLIMLWQSLIPVVKFKVLKHRDFEFVNITSKSEFLQFFTQYDHYLLMGDLNYDVLCKNNKGTTLFDLMELFDLCNLIKEHTCIMKNCKNSLLSVYILMSFDFPLIRLFGVREFCYYPYLYMIFSKFLHSRSCLLLAGMSVLMNAAKHIWIPPIVDLKRVFINLNNLC
jgi:hypothetical protein